MEAIRKAEITDKLNKHFAELKAGRFIMSESRISQILKYIASEKELMRLIASINIDFYFEDEYEHAVQDLGDGKKVFRLPQADKKLAALVTGLLYKFDRRQLNFHEFISKFYSSLTANDEFALFYDGIMEPYRVAFLALVSADDSAPIVIEDETAPARLEEAALTQIVPIIVKLTEEIAAAKLPSARTRECFAVLEGLYYALESGDERMLRAVFVGVRYALASVKFLQPYLKSLENLLKIYFTMV